MLCSAKSYEGQVPVPLVQLQDTFEDLVQTELANMMNSSAMKRLLTIKAQLQDTVPRIHHPEDPRDQEIRQLKQKLRRYEEHERYCPLKEESIQSPKPEQESIVALLLETSLNSLTDSVKDEPNGSGNAGAIVNIQESTAKMVFKVIIAAIVALPLLGVEVVVHMLYPTFKTWTSHWTS